MAVYEKSNKKNAFKEKDSLEPLSPYGVSKLASGKDILLMAPNALPGSYCVKITDSNGCFYEYIYVLSNKYLYKKYLVFKNYKEYLVMAIKKEILFT